MATKQRIEYIDLAKGFCIILVVWVHLAAFYTQDIPYADFFKSFRMPLYFFLSGCFFKTYRGLWDFIKRKTNKLLIPFLFWFLITSVVVSNLLVRVFHCNSDILHPIDAPMAIWNEKFPNEPLWFLLCLFEDSLLFYSIHLWAHKSQKHSSLILLILSMMTGLIGLFLGYNRINLPLYLDSALSAMPFFALGYFTYRKTNILNPNRYDKYLPLLIIAAFSLISPICTFYSFMLNKFSLQACLAVYPCGILGTYGVVMLAKLLKHLPFVSYLGRYSIMILVTHIDVFNAYAALLKHCDIPEEIAFYINLLTTLISYLAIIPLMKKLVPHVTAQKDIIPIR